MNKPLTLGMFFLVLLGLSVSGADSYALDRARIRNPFALPSGVEIQGKQKEVMQPPANLALKAVIESDHRKIATINKENFVVGDIAFGRNVMEIGENYVILGEGKEKITLWLNKPVFTVDVTHVP